MKKLSFLLISMILASAIFAEKLIQINVDNDADIKQYYSNSAIRVHYQCENFILASVPDEFSGTCFTMDEQCWSKGQTYYIAWFHKGSEMDYVAQMEKNTTIVKKTNDYLLIIASDKDQLFPPVNGRLVKINNKELKLPQKKFGYTKGSLLLDPDIEDMMDEVDTNIYIGNVQQLQNYGTRNAYTPESILAQNWIKAEYESYGYSVELFDFSMPNGPASDNVIATKLGTKYPDEFVVIGGHYDSYSYSGNAPGADDDASGTCGVMEVARVMADFETDRTVIFCAFSGEEYGLYGSEAYADWAAGEGMNILGYFNIDMCGYRHPGDPIHTDMIAPSSAQPLVEFYTDVCGMYLPDFIIEPGMLSGGDSDHTSFNNAGYMGIFPFEDSQHYSPYIHTSNDVIGTSLNSLEMAQMFIKAMVANVASMANYLAPPANLMAIPGDEVIELMWDDLEDIDNYNVYKNGETTPVASPTEPYFLDEDVVNFNTYEYYVTVIYTETGEESSPSNMVTVIPLPPMSMPFYDDFETGAMYWNFESPWGLSQSQFHSPSKSMTESPTGDYLNNLEVSTVLYSFSLENTETASLSFWTRYELESGYDYTWLEITTNGNTWTELDEYNGMQTNWTLKEYSLDAYLGEPYVVLRFRFYSDTYVTEDGMYIDDLELLVENTGTGVGAPAENEEISIFPNPFKGLTHIAVKGNSAEPVSIIVYNSVGQVVKEFNGSGNESSITFTFNGSELPSGIYYCRITYDGKTENRKIVLSN